MKPHAQAKGGVLVEVPVDIYDLEVIHAAAYAFLDRAHVVLDGDPKTRIKALLIPKCDAGRDALALDFNDELNNYAFFIGQSRRNKEVKDAIVRSALFAAVSPAEGAGRLKKQAAGRTGRRRSRAPV